MAQKKQNKRQGGGQQFLSPEQFVRQRIRSLPLGKCYITDSALDVGGICHVVVTRQHTGGRVSMAMFMVDLFCVGVKESFFRLRLEPEELDGMLQFSGEAFAFNECSYAEAHNRIYGAIAFAEGGGVKPDKSFALTQYFLEEDTDEVPLIEYEYGHDGKHFLFCETQLEASRYLPQLRKTLGNDGFTYVIGYENLDDALGLDGEPDCLGQGPVSMEQLVRRMGYDDLYACAETLFPDIDPDLYLSDLRQEYVDRVLGSPLTVLSMFGSDDLNSLQELDKHPEWGCELPYFEGAVTPMMVHYGFAEEGWKDDTRYVVRVAEDFLQAAKPLLDKVQDDDAVQMCTMIASVVEGLANLYGEVDRKDAVDFIKRHILKKKDTPVDNIFDYVCGHSLTLDWMQQPIEDYGEPTGSLPPEKAVFFSRYGWDDCDALHEAIRQGKAKNRPRKPFSPDDVTYASRGGMPLIANKRRKTFEHFLSKKLGMNYAETTITCYDLWLRAQHEDDKDYEGDTWAEYFEETVLDDVDETLKDEARAQLQAYMDHTPRWTLKGYAPAEL